MGTGVAGRKRPGADKVSAFAQMAERYRRKGDAERAVQVCLEGLEKFPEHLSGRVTLGWAYLDLGQYQEARAALEQVMRRAPDNLAAIRGLAELHQRSESTELEEMPEGWQAAASAETVKADAVSPGADQDPVLTASVEPVSPEFVTASDSAMAGSAVDPALAEPDKELTSALAGLEAELGVVGSGAQVVSSSETSAAGDDEAAARRAEELAEREAAEAAVREAEARAEREAAEKAEAAERAEREAAERAEREAAELAAREAAELAAREAAEKAQAEKEAAERAEREAEEKAAREAAEEAARQAAEKAEREAEERAAREAEERAAREAADKADREAAAKAAREAAELAAREAAETAAREFSERVEREAAERAAREAEEKAEREAVEQAAREAAEQAEREAREAREAAEQAEAEKEREEAERVAAEADRRAAEAEHLAAEAAYEAVQLREQAQQEHAGDVADSFSLAHDAGNAASADDDSPAMEAASAFADAHSDAADLAEHMAAFAAADDRHAETGGQRSSPGGDDSMVDLDSPLVSGGDASEAQGLDSALFAQFETSEADDDVDADDAEAAELVAADATASDQEASPQDDLSDAGHDEQIAAFSSLEPGDFTPPTPSEAAEPGVASGPFGARAVPPSPAAARIRRLEGFLRRVRSRRLRAAAESVA